MSPSAAAMASKTGIKIVFLGAAVLVLGALIARQAGPDVFAVQRQYPVAIPWPSSTFSAVFQQQPGVPLGRGDPEIASTFIISCLPGGYGISVCPSFQSYIIKKNVLYPQPGGRKNA